MDEFPVKILASGRHLCTGRDWGAMKNFKVPFFRVYHVEDGSGAVIVDGMRSALAPGRLYFIPGGLPSSNECDGKMRVSWLHGLAMSPPMERMVSSAREVRSWDAWDLGVFRDSVRNIASADYSELVPETLAILSMVLFLLSDACSSQRAFSSLVHPSVKAALAYMDERFAESPPLRLVAKKAGLAPLYLHRVFKNYCGVTPHEYMERKRLAFAERLLLTTDKTLDETARLCGYENVFYFSRVFKKRFGESPGRLRKMRESRLP